MEGVSAEASSIAGHLGLDNLVVFYDDNHITIDGETALAFSEDVGKRYEAYGWFVQRDRRARPRADPRRARHARSPHKGKPSLHRRAHAHRQRLAEQARHDGGARRAARQGRGRADQEGTWAAIREKHFFVPGGGLRALHGARGGAREGARRLERARRRVAQGQRRARRAARRLRDEDGPGEPLRGAPQGASRRRTTRRATSRARSSRSSRSSCRRSSAARPTSRPRRRRSSRTAGASGRGKFAGRNIHFGIREHGMGAVVQRHGALGRHHPVRRDVPHLQRLHAPGDPPLGARASSSASGSSRTTRSSSARTGRRTSRSSSSGRSASSRTSTSCARPTRSSAPRRGRIAMHAQGRPDGDRAHAAEAPDDQARRVLRSERRAQAARTSRRRRPAASRTASSSRRAASSSSRSARASELEAEGKKVRVVSALLPRGVREAGRRLPRHGAAARACRRCSIEAGRTPPWRVDRRRRRPRDRHRPLRRERAGQGPRREVRLHGRRGDRHDPRLVALRREEKRTKRSGRSGSGDREKLQFTS